MRASTLLSFSLPLVVGGLCFMHGTGFMAGFNTTPLGALTTLASHSAPPGAPSKEANGRVMVVVVDGMRADYAEHLGLVPGAAMPRAACLLESVLPSYSRPAYVALSTGVPPWASGVHTNDHEGPAGLPSIWDVARRAGIRTELVADGTNWWVELFPDAFDRVEIVPKRDFDAFWQRWTPPSEGLLLLHIVAADDAGHDFGADSTEYRAAIAQAGRFIQRLLDALDPARDTLLVTADHGHIDRGGHGGPEPEVLTVPLFAFGAGVVPNPATRGADVPWCGSLVDLPVAIAARLGLVPPVAGLGGLFPIIVPRDKGFSHQLTAQTLAVHDALGPHGADAIAQARARPASLRAMVLALALWLGLVALFGRVLVGPARRALASALLVPLAFAVVYALFEPTLSLSAVWLRDPWTVRLGLLSAATGLLVSVFVFRRHAPAEALVLLTAGAALPLLLGVAAHGALSAGPILGEPHAAFAVVLGDVFAAAACGAAVLAAMVAFAREARRARAKVWVD